MYVRKIINNNANKTRYIIARKRYGCISIVNVANRMIIVIAINKPRFRKLNLMNLFLLNFCFNKKFQINVLLNEYEMIDIINNNIPPIRIKNTTVFRLDAIA